MINPMKKLNLKYLIGSILIIVSLSACNAQAEQTTQTQAVDDVTVQLDWIHTIEYAGFYTADAKGYFADQNLSVKFNTNDGSTNVVDKLVTGEADFAVTGADTLLVAREQGADVVAIATIYQILPLGFMSLAENQILSPNDFSGRTVMLSMGRTSEHAFRAMINSVGMDISTINIVPRDVFTNDPLLNGDVDVLDVFVTNQVVQMRQSDIDVNVVLPLDYGVEMYVNVITTTQAMIDENPELVERFVKATVQGLQAVVADAEEATQLTLKVNPDLVYESELESMRTSLPLIQPTGSQPGQMSVSTWQYIHDMLLEQGILSEALDIEAAYNLSFVEKAYAQ